jgi:hypothetical protein
MSARTTKSFLGRNHREINKGKQKFEFQKTKQRTTAGSGGLQDRSRKYDRARGGYDG